MYTDMLIVFWQSRGLVHASVYERHFPNGRQRRYEVAKYTLGDPATLSSPGALLAALDEALGTIPDYVIR